jgi:hypothetical protein
VSNSLTPDQNGLAEKYRNLSDDNLLQLALDGGLTAEAELALRTEMGRRSLSKKDVNALADWEEQQKPPPPPPQRVFLGYGTRFVGKKFLTPEDERQGIFVATKFVVLRYSSIFPIGSYRVIQRDGKVPQIENRVPLQWDQVWLGVRFTLVAIFVGFAAAAVSIYFANRKR